VSCPVIIYSFQRGPVRLLVCIALLLTSAVSLAQQSSDGDNRRAAGVLPPWVVLALKPVGADRVRPVTGVVVSGQGLVIVPYDFAAPGDQIIVLDGGTDIVANGRAATIRQQIPEAGLTLISAPALKRQPAALSLTPLADDAEVRLAAFPPAELIAEGAAPVSVSTRVKLSMPAGPGGGPGSAIATAQALPNVSGPLLDRCGNLVGFSLADGVQSMETTKAPAHVWKDELLRVLRGLELELTQAPCPAVSPSQAESAGPPAAADEAGQESEAAPVEAEGEVRSDRVDGAALTQSAEEPSAGLSRIRLMWLGLLALLLLAGVTWLLYRKRTPSTNRSAPAYMADEVAAGPGPPATGRKDSQRETDCVVEVSGRLPDGSPFISSCDVNGAAINLVVGRSRADINIDSEHIHREHARLSGSADGLTISDLGSARGTWINRVPCMKGEIMFIGADDTIFLGDVSFQVSVRKRPGQETDSGES